MGEDHGGATRAVGERGETTDLLTGVSGRGHTFPQSTVLAEFPESIIRHAGEHPLYTTGGSSSSSSPPLDGTTIRDEFNSSFYNEPRPLLHDFLPRLHHSPPTTQQLTSPVPQNANLDYFLWKASPFEASDPAKEPWVVVRGIENKLQLLPLRSALSFADNRELWKFDAGTGSIVTADGGYAVGMDDHGGVKLLGQAEARQWELGADGRDRGVIVFRDQLYN